MAFMWFLAAQMGPPPAEVAVYRCLDNTMFSLSTTPGQAIVRFTNGLYRLPRRPSALAIKYANETATLFLDGDFAAFVADDRPLPGCTRVRPAVPGKTP